MATSLSGSASGVLHIQVKATPRRTELPNIKRKLCAPWGGFNAAQPILLPTHLVRCAELPT
eukprot:SAG31_NODE_40664_length_279_cov_1.288889_1_plen_60_part_10